MPWASRDKYSDRARSCITLADGRDVDMMVTDGYAVEWNGKGERPVPAWPLPE